MGGVPKKHLPTFWDREVAMGSYRCVATSVQGFIQQVAVSYVMHGYVFYVSGVVPPGKDLEKVDRKLLELYDIQRSRAARSRRKMCGQANVQYIRHERFFVLLATRGAHEFFAKEKFRDIRRQPLRYAGYSVSLRYSTFTRKWHPSVRIDREEYLTLKARFEDLACRRSVDALGEEFRGIRFEPYAPVARQLFCILRSVNRRRTAGGFEAVSPWWLRLRRGVVRVFDWKEQAVDKEGQDAKTNDKATGVPGEAPGPTLAAKEAVGL